MKGGRRFVSLTTQVLLVAILFLLPSTATARVKGHANIFLGLKMLDKGDWEPLEDQPEAGVELTWGDSLWPILIATDILRSSDDGTVDAFPIGKIDIEGSTIELDVGMRKIWEKENVRPFLGGGIAVARAKIGFDALGLSFSEDGDGVGAWIGGGVFWRVGSRVNLGISGRFSSVDVTIDGEDFKAGGSHLGLLLGWGWPAGN